MRLMFDEEYEDIDSSIRSFDQNKYCLFIDQAGYNEHRDVVDVHWHEWLEIVHIIDGDMVTITPHGRYEVKKGDIIVVGMQALHKMVGNVGNYRFQCLHINVGFILQHMSSAFLTDKVFMINEKNPFLECFSNIVSKMKHDDVISQLEYKAEILNLLAQCLKESKLDMYQINYEFHDTFSDILFYVSNHYREDISLQDIACRFKYTTQHISLMFKKYLDTNYYTYLTKLRLNRAMFLLMTSNKRIIDIALECGFASEHSFINNFKKWYHLTPAKYRKEYKKE